MYFRLFTSSKNIWNEIDISWPTPSYPLCPITLSWWHRKREWKIRLDKTRAVRLRKRTKYTFRGTTTVLSAFSEIAQIWLKGSRQQGSTELSLNNTLWFSLPLVQFFLFFFLFVHSCTNITPLIYTYHICKGWSLHYNRNNCTEKSEMRDPCCLFRD